MTQITVNSQRTNIKETNELQVKSNLIESKLQPTTVIKVPTDKRVEALNDNHLSKCKFIWERRYFNEKKEEVVERTKMSEMSPQHLQNAYYKSNHKTTELQKSMDIWLDLTNQIEIIAEQRGIKLLEADDSFVKNNKNYHKSNK